MPVFEPMQAGAAAADDDDDDGGDRGPAAVIGASPEVYDPMKDVPNFELKPLEAVTTMLGADGFIEVDGFESTQLAMEPPHTPQAKAVAHLLDQDLARQER
eukprot:COSAG01_NODE_959_length_12451_cov_18.389815_7_plen_101_part_00